MKIIPALYSRTRLLIASVTESAALNRSSLQLKSKVLLRPDDASSLSAAAAFELLWDSGSTEGLLRLGDEEVDGVERGESC